MLENTIKIPQLNPVDSRIIAVSSQHLKGSVSEIEFLEYGERKFEIKKNWAGLSTFWQWSHGEPFPDAMVTLSGAEITPSILKDYGIKKVYFFLVKEIHE